MANLTGTEIKTKLALLLKDTSDVSDNLLLLWLNMADDMFYRELTRLDPDRYLKTKTFYGSTSYTLPTDFNNMRTGGIYLTAGGSNYSVLKYDAQTGNFTVGNTITGASSGATGVILEDNDTGTSGYLTLANVSGVFEDNETITDTGTGSATTDSANVPFSQDNNRVFELNYGELNRGILYPGFQINGTTLTVDNSSDIYQLVYIPNKAELTTLPDSLTLDRQYQSVFLNDIQKLYFKWSEDPANFNWEEQIFFNTLTELRKNYPRTSRVMRFDVGSGMISSRIKFINEL